MTSHREVELRTWALAGSSDSSSTWCGGRGSFALGDDMDCATFVINLAYRSDRRIEMQRELSRVGWDAEFFPAIRPTSPDGFPSIGARGCFLSHLTILKKAHSSGAERLLILEDDLNFVHDFKKHWPVAMEQLALREWYIFYPAHLLKGFPPGMSLLSPSIGVMCTHFVMFNKVAIPKIIAELEDILSRPGGHLRGGPMHIDGAYSTIRKNNENMSTLIYYPVLGYQRSSSTDIGVSHWFDRIAAMRPSVKLYRNIKNLLKRTFSH